ncbi:MAG: NupC/NupG family nucleoside CNT transporter, partial [Planctomycetota bacterium]|nr:NupC/NupG family nucleoside CNT transporter [Planctomycetota bacterium]
MPYLRALLGIAFFCAVAWALSSHKRRFPWRVVLFGLSLQVGLGLLILKTELGRRFFDGIATFVQTLIARTSPAAEMVFGDLAKADGTTGFIFAFASSGLIVIIFFSALMSVLYHLGIMQVIIWVLARVMSATMGVSGAEAMAMAANVFVGQTEAPLVVKPYIPNMTMSELNAMMTGGFATIAGSVLAVYMGILGPEIGPHLLTASVMSAPAAFLVAKIMQPEVEVSATAGAVPLKFERPAANLVEAAANGTQDGLKLWLNVIAMLIAFIALVALIDWPLEWLGATMGLEGGLSLGRIFGWVFAPVAWLMGVEGWHDSQLFGSLLGTKITINEFVAFGRMQELIPSFENPRTAQMAAYALCGFANFGSVGIQIGGISPIAPNRKTDISRLALRAML